MSTNDVLQIHMWLFRLVQVMVSRYFQIIQNFEVSLEPGYEEIDVLYEIFIRPKEPIRFVFKERKWLASTFVQIAIGSNCKAAFGMA